MVKKFVVNKDSVGFEIFIDGTVEVKALPHNTFHNDTLNILAAKHKVVIERLWIGNNDGSKIDVAVNYFEESGFEIKEK